MRILQREKQNLSETVSPIYNNAGSIVLATSFLFLHSTSYLPKRTKQNKATEETFTSVRALGKVIQPDQKATGRE